MDVLRQAREIEIAKSLFVYEDVAASNLGLERFDLSSQLAIVRQELRTHVGATFDERLAHEDFASFARRDAAVVDAPLCRQREAVERRGFQCRDEPPVLDPMGF